MPDIVIAWLTITEKAHTGHRSMATTTLTAIMRRYLANFTQKNTNPQTDAKTKDYGK